jgi:hypothetical protein
MDFCRQRVSSPLFYQQDPQMRLIPTAMFVVVEFACGLHCVLPWMSIMLDQVLLPDSAIVMLWHVIVIDLVIL